MAGGMHRGRSGRSLGERAASSGIPAAAAFDPLGPGPADEPAVPGGRRREPAGSEPAEGRHCWVHDPPGAPGTWPGLLVEWRQRSGVWQGRVAYTMTGPHGPALVEAWLPADRLRPR